MELIWKDIPGITGYQVSNAGDIRSLKRKVLRKDGKETTVPGTEFVSTDNQGKYKLFYAKGTNNYVHVAVLSAFVGPKPDNSYEACHNNGNHKDNRIDNLRWDTQSSNMFDRVRHGTHHQTIKTSCPRGHGFEDWNLVLSKKAKGYRECLACSKEYFSARYAKRSFDFEKANRIYESLRPPKE